MPIRISLGRVTKMRCILKAIKHDLVIYSAHTNLDNASEGVNHKIAEKLGLKHLQILAPKDNSLTKLVTFVPTEHAARVRQALFDAGCGNIGRYDSCSYNLSGEGTFRAGEGTHPFCGTIGELHHEQEVRIETILPQLREGAAIRALLKAHPYEEPAYDLYPLHNRWEQAGSGMIGELDEPEDEMTFLQRIKQTFKVSCLRHNQPTGRQVRRVALCGGAGAFLLPQAISAGANVFLTGEIKYHDYFGHEAEILMAEIGHYESEQYTVEILQSVLQHSFPDLKVQLSKINTNPIKYL